MSSGLALAEGDTTMNRKPTTRTTGVGGIRIAVFVFAVSLVARCARADTTEIFNSTASACDQNGVCNFASSTGPFVTATSPNGGFVSATAQATFNVSYGSLSLETDASGIDDPNFGVGNSEISATVGFSDVVTIFGGSGEGQLSFAAIQQGHTDWYPGAATASFLIVPEIPSTFTFGTPFDLGAQLSASAGGIIFTGSASATFTLTGLSVSDANGNPISGYTYADASGTIYQFEGGEFVATPEPGSGFLLLLGLTLTRLRSLRL
jgi:hypothetical protein